MCYMWEQLSSQQCNYAQYTSEFLAVVKMQNICKNSFKPREKATQSPALKIKHGFFVRNCLRIKQRGSKGFTTARHFEKNFKKHQMERFNKIFRRKWIVKTIHASLRGCYAPACVKGKRRACKWHDIQPLLTLGFWSTAFFMFFSRWLFGPPSFSLT